MTSQMQRTLSRHRGHRGGLIVPHRAIRTLDLNPARAFVTVIAVLGVTALWVLALNGVTGFWRIFMQAALDRFGGDGGIEVVRYPIHPLYTLEVPRIALAAAELTGRLWWAGAIGTAVMLAASWLLPGRWLPVRMILRIMALVQLSAQLYFRLRPEAFPYDIGGYTEVLLTAGVMVIGLVPVIYGLTFYPLDFESGQKLLITLLAMVHLSLFIPVQFLLHAVLLHVGSLLFMPLLFWAFGLTLDVFVIITLYGWAASWQTVPYRHRHWWISLRPALPLLLGLAVLMTLVGVATSAHGQSTDWRTEIEVGGSYGRYDQDLGDLQSQFVRLRRSLAFEQGWMLDVGRAERFQDEGFGLGLGHRRHLRRDTSLSAGLATGTGDVIFPRWRVDASIEHGVLAGDPVLVTLGYTHIQSKAENESDGVTVGARWYTPSPLILGGFVRREWGSPGSTTSTSYGVGLLHHRPGRTTWGAGIEYGDVSYLLIGPSEALVDFRIRSAHVAGSHYLGRRWGMAARVEGADADFYRLWAIELKAFWQW